MKMKIKIDKKKIIILITIIILVICITLIILNFSRTSKINEQLLNYISEDGKTTISFNSGKNIKINDNVYEKLKEQEIDVIIYNDVYIATVKSSDLQQYMDIDVNLKKNDIFNDSYDVNVDSNVKCDIKVNVKSTLGNVKYISQYNTLNDNLNVIANDIQVNEDGFSNIIQEDNINNYIIAYVEPTEFNVQDIEVNNTTKTQIDIGIDKSKYTKGSFYIECNDKEAIEFEDYSTLVAKKAGDYKLKLITNSGNVTKEVNLKIQEVAQSIQVDKTDVELEVGQTLKVEVTILPQEAVNKEVKWESTDENVATVDKDGNITAINEGTCKLNVSTMEEPIATASVNVNVKAESDNNYYTYNSGNSNDITYINGILLVNKNHPIPRDYAPGLQDDAYNAFLRLSADAANAGFDIQLLSGYRSYDTQDRLYNNYVAVYGQAEADTFSARPGTSEHQTGLAMDVGWIDDTYGDTPSGIWLAQNCYKYGFIIRYPKGKENITGYKYEPWHIRYLGVDIAKDVYESGLCLEEYLGVN